MKNVKIWARVGILSAAAVAGTWALAWSGPAAAEGLGWRGLHRLLRGLNLTQTQTVQATALFYPVRQNAQALRRERQTLRAAWAEELAKAEPDRERLHQMVDEMMDARRQVGHEALDALLELHGSFTPEQRAELQMRLSSARTPASRPGDMEP